MRLLSHIFLLAFLVVTATACRAESDSRSELPYEAVTVDECIHEKECVWYYFEKMIDRAKFGEKNDGNLARWATDIKFGVLGYPTIPVKQNIHDAFNQISSFFPYKIEESVTGLNTLVLISDNFQEDVNGKYKKILMTMFKSDMFIKIFNMTYAVADAPESCISFPFFAENKEYLGNVILISPDKKKLSQCAALHTLRTVGLAGGSEDLPLSANSEAANGGKNTLNKLDLFLVYLLYSDTFKTGMPIAEVEMAFNNGYQKVLGNFEERGTVR